MLLHLACVVLAPLGFQIETFRDPNDALQCFAKAERKPELVITDYAMHKINGLELVAKCKELHPGQKVILVSGTVGPEVFADSPVKPDFFLPKPYEVEQLREAVKDLLKMCPQSESLSQTNKPQRARKKASSPGQAPKTSSG